MNDFVFTVHDSPPLRTAIRPRMMDWLMGRTVRRTMPKRAAGLTARRVETQRKQGLFADGGGLYLRVSATGAKLWLFRYQIGGRGRGIGNGAAAVVTCRATRGDRGVAPPADAAGPGLVVAPPSAPTAPT